MSALSWGRVDGGYDLDEGRLKSVLETLLWSLRKNSSRHQLKRVV